MQTIRRIALFFAMAAGLAGGLTLISTSSSASNQPTKPGVIADSLSGRKASTAWTTTITNYWTYITTAVGEQEAAAAQAAQAAANAAALSAQHATTVQTSYIGPPAVPITSAGGGGTWEQLAICEEGGSNNPTFGYFGILSGNWPAGYSPGDDEATQEQAVLILNHGAIPYAPVGCVSAGYQGW